MRNLKLVVGILLLPAACGGNDGPTDPPGPPPAAVASIEVTPAAAALVVPEAVQLAATPRDASGNALTGKPIVWSTSAGAVATVSGAGLVTSVSAGTATISASSGSVTGSATVTVTQFQGGPVIAKADIGPAGGTVGTSDIAVTIPPGAFASSQTLVLIRDTVETHPFPENAASLIYRIDGIPAGQTVEARVRIRRTAALLEQAAIDFRSPVVPSVDTVPLEMGHRLVAATDSAGYLVATASIRGRPATWARSAGPTLAATVYPGDFRAAAEISGLVGLRTMLSAAGHFKGWGVVRGATTATEADRLLGKALALLEQAYARASQMGYTYQHRTVWPMDVYIMPHPSWWGCWYSHGPSTEGVNLGYINLNPAKLDDATAIGGTAMHEFFHFVQEQFAAGLPAVELPRTSWLKEATSTWIEEYHPASPSPYAAPIARGWKDSLFAGLTRDLSGSSGYGKAPMIRYLANRWGVGRVRELWEWVGAGTPSLESFFGNFPEPVEIWWPDLLRQHLTSGLYPWPPDARIPAKHTPGTPVGTPLLNEEVAVPLGEYSDLILDSHPLRTRFVFLLRDTTRFGPGYRLPAFLASTDLGTGVLLAFHKAAGAPGYQHLATGDTVYFPGAILQSRDTVLLLVTQTSAGPPFTGHSALEYFVDMTLPEADWYFPAVRNLADHFTYTCNPAGDKDSIDVASTVTSVFSMLAGGGTWQTSAPERWEWGPTPQFADSLRKYQMTAASSLRLKGGDSLIVEARLAVNLASALWAGTPLRLPRLPGWAWLLVPVTALPFLLRRRSRWAAPWAAAATALVIAACDVGVIAFVLDESFEFRFGKIRLVADASTPNAVQVELRDGVGTSTLNSYRSEVWVYTRNSKGEKTDSTRRTCTGTGTATFTVDGNGWLDGVAPPAAGGPPRLTALRGRPVPVPQAWRSLAMPR